MLLRRYVCLRIAGLRCIGTGVSSPNTIPEIRHEPKGQKNNPRNLHLWATHLSRSRSVTKGIFRCKFNNNFASYKIITKKSTLKFITSIITSIRLWWISIIPYSNQDTLQKKIVTEQWYLALLIAENRRIIIVFVPINEEEHWNIKVYKKAYRDRQRYKRLNSNGLPLDYATPTGSH